MKQAIQKGQITVPPRPRTNAQIKPVVDALVTSVQQLRDRRVFYSQSPRSSGGSSQDTSWKLSVALDGEEWKYQVSSQRSTVQDGTNGPIIDLDDPTPIFDEPFTIPATRYVALKATVGTDLALTDWMFELYEDRPDEVLIEEDEDEALRQTELRFLIGKITIEGTPETATVEQIATLPQRIVTVFLNGKICKGITTL